MMFIAWKEIYKREYGTAN